jgi:hypothetical protein
MVQSRLRCGKGVVLEPNEALVAAEMFAGITGLPQGLPFVTEFCLPAQPAAGKRKLTQLEGRLGMALQGASVSLILPPHGVTDDRTLMWVGLSWPASWEGLTTHYIQYNYMVGK